MDEDSEKERSLGAYENMTGYESSIRPDFEAQQNNSGESTVDKAKNTLKRGEKAAIKKGLEVGIDALTGGTGGSALKVAEKGGGAAGLADAIAGSSKDDEGMSSSLKAVAIAAAPAVGIAAVLVIVIYGVSSFVGQWLFPDGYRNRVREDNNSTAVSTTKRSDEYMNEYQLGENQSSKYGDVVFNNMEPTALQKGNMADYRIYYSDEGGEKALLFGNISEPEMIIVSDSAVSANGKERIAQGGESITDSSSDDNFSLEDRKAEIIANLKVSADTGKVYGFTEAMNVWKFKQQYIMATKTWRGDVSGWYNQSQEVTQKRTAISRNNFKDFTLTGDNEKNEEEFIKMTKEATAKNLGAEDAKGGKSYQELVEEVAKNSSDPNCGASSAATDIEGIYNSVQTVQQVTAGSLMMEAIDKTIAGKGEEAPLTAAMNIFFRAGAADTEGIHNLFGSGSLDQGNENLLAASGQANIGGNGTANLAAGDPDDIRVCFYEGNTHEHDGEGGLITKIGSMFKKVAAWVKGAFDSLSNFLKKLVGWGGVGDPGVANAVLQQTVEKFENNEDRTYFSGEDDKVLGEAMRNATEKMYGEHAKGFGQVSGDEGAAKMTYLAHQEIIAEQAEFDQRTKSPFDISSRYTFLGSIAYSLIPMAISSQSLSLTSTLGKLGTMVGNAVASLTPASSAVSLSGLQDSQGDCVKSNSTISFANAYCNDYQNTDLSMTGKGPVDIFETVADLRYDEGGYVYRNEEGGRDPDIDPDYGDGPVNPAENGISPTHWGEPTNKVPGTVSHGCESDWEIEIVTNPDTGAVTELYNLDKPIEWKYSRVTNFEYAGYESGWRNVKKDGTKGMENAKNDDAPGECELDFYIDPKTKQPKINLNGSLAQFQILAGQRTSEKGDPDAQIISRLTKIDFTKGRLHPCAVGQKEECEEYEEKYGWTDDESVTASSAIMSRWIGGTTYTYYTHDIGSIKTGMSESEMDVRFRDPTMGNQYFWNEIKWYQAFVELLGWMESNGMVSANTSTVNQAIAQYYKENPLDNSYEGIIARYSGKKKEQVIAVFNLMQYVAFLAKYDPSNLYPMPVPLPDILQYDNGEIVAQSEQVIQSLAIVYDELRNRTVTV